MCQKVKGTEKRDLQGVILQPHSNRAMKMSFAEPCMCVYDCDAKTENAFLNAFV